MTDDVDIIERTVEINAPAERVWDLVAEPGWYINDGAIVAHRIDRDGDLSYVHDEKHGRFAFATVSLDRPRYAAFRWLDNPDAADSASTLVEFTITAADRRFGDPDRGGEWIRLAPGVCAGPATPMGGEHRGLGGGARTGPDVCWNSTASRCR